MDLALCYAFDFAMIVVRWIASVRMVSVSFLSLLRTKRSGALRRTNNIQSFPHNRNPNKNVPIPVPP
jgi:hypothetical protein